MNWELYLLISGETLLPNPIYELLLLDDRFPVLRIPLVLIQFLVSDTRRSANENDAGVVSILNVDIPENENVGITANKALDG